MKTWPTLSKHLNPHMTKNPQSRRKICDWRMSEDGHCSVTENSLKCTVEKTNGNIEALKGAWRWNSIITVKNTTWRCEKKTAIVSQRQCSPAPSHNVIINSEEAESQATCCYSYSFCPPSFALAPILSKSIELWKSFSQAGLHKVPGRLGRLGRLARCPVGRGCEYRDGGAETRRPFAGESELGCKSAMSRLARQD